MPRLRVLVGLMALLLPSSGGAVVQRARPADEFVGSVGVCTHWSYPDTPYGARYEDVKKLLLDLGVRHVRDGFSERIPDLGAAGIRSAVVCEPDVASPEEWVRKVKSANAKHPSVDAVEGPNEPDFFWNGGKRTYNGKGFPEGVTAFQRDLYKAMKGDSATRNTVVFGPALGKTYDPGGGSPNPFAPGSLEPFVDRGNFHPYPGGNTFSVPFPYAGIQKYLWHGSMPSANLDEFPYSFNTYQPPFGAKPMVATETGYSTERGGATEAVQAAYVPRLFAEYFRAGIRQTYLYEFVDEWNRPDDREACLGIVRNDLTPKPAFTALKSLLTLLRDPAGKKAKPVDLDLAITVTPPPGYDRTQYVHHLLLSKADGSIAVLLWHEIALQDTSSRPFRTLTHPDIPVRLTFAKPLAGWSRYTYDAEWKLRSSGGGAKVNVVNATVDERIQVILLRPATVGRGDGSRK